MHKSLFKLSAIVVQLLVAGATPGAIAQPAPSPSAYAGQQTRAIKALSEQDIDDLLLGRGAGLAKAAELNGHPGPAHVLELQGPLRLSQTQLLATQALMAQHRATAQRLGTRLVAAERSLDESFSSHTADEGSVRRLTAEIGQLQAELRAEHLRTHLAQTELLTPEQVDRYAELRGYAKPQAVPAQRQHRH